MGTSYRQYCLIGFFVPKDELEVEISPEIIDKQPRYDTRTGEITHYQTVIVKHAKNKYVFDEETDESIEDLAYLLQKKYKGLHFITHYDYCSGDCEGLYVGYNLLNKNNNSNIELLNGVLSLEFLEEMKQKIQKIFPDRGIYVYLIPEIG